MFVGAFFKEDGLDARFEKLVIELRSLRVGRRGRLRRRSGNSRVKQDGSHKQKPSRNYFWQTHLWQNPGNHHCLSSVSKLGK
jgi:hypothetical protein